MSATKLITIPGQPADNAAHFVEWLSSLSGSELSKVSFAVFGCGNHDWVSTYQRIPTLCDDLFAKLGGKRLLARGAGDAGSAEFFETFDHWEAQLWTALAQVRELGYFNRAALTRGV